MHLFIVSAFDFGGHAPVVARHRALLAGWVESELGPATLCLLTTPAGSEPHLGAGVTTVGVGLPGRGWRVRAVWGLARLLVRMRADGRLPEAALIVDRDPIYLFTAIAVLRKFGVKALHEITEYPDVVSGTGGRGRLEFQAFRRVVLPRLDGVVVISPQLHTWVRGLANVPTTRVAGIVDVSRYPHTAEPNVEEGVVIGYCGSLDERKDGVGALVGVVAQLPSSAGVRLRVIAGPHSRDQRQELDSVIEQAGMHGRVEVVGPVPHDDVPALLAGCHVLALPRPVSRQAEGGFPTKLGEYLATGRPVVVSAVGSVPGQLKNGAEAMIVAPGDSEGMRRTLETLVSDAYTRGVVGAAGRMRAEQAWSPTGAARAVAVFVDEEVMNRG